MTKMQSLAWRNGQNGPHSQSQQAAFQLSYGPMRNQKNGTAKKSDYYLITQTGAPRPENAQLVNYYGAFFQTQPSNWQTTAVHTQAFSAGGNNHLKPSPAYLQSGNPTFQQNFHCNTAQNSSTQGPPNMTVTDIAYPQKEISANCNQSVVSGGQHYWNLNSNFHNLNGEPTKPVSPYTTTATPLQQREVAYNDTMGPAAEHLRQTACRHNSTRHGFKPPSYNKGIAQSFRNNMKTTNSSRGQNSHVRSTSQVSQQYSTHNNRGEATSSINLKSYKRQCKTNLFLSKAGAQQEILKRRQSIKRIEDYLRMPPTTDSDQNMQPVKSTVTEMNNSNASQVIPQSLRHSSSKASLQSSVPNVFHVSATGDVIGHASQAAFSPENKVGSLSGASQLMQLLEGIEPQINENQSSVQNNCERHEMLSVKSNDSSIHLSPGRTRAVAVVQPLLHESYQVASKHNSCNTISQLSEGTATDKSLSNPEKLFTSPKTNPVVNLKVGPNLHLENPNVSQNGDKDKREMPKDAERVELSSVPTTPWTPVTLTKLIRDLEKSQIELKESTVPAVHKIMRMFWDGNSNNLKSMLRSHMCNSLFSKVRQFCREHSTPESAILSQVNSCFETQLKNYHVLQDKEVYLELPYKSSWLNVNEQLDDIDKDFDFPPSLKYLNILKSDSQLDTEDVETDNSIVAQTAKEVSNRMFSSTELEQVHLSEEEQDSSSSTELEQEQDSFVEATPTQTASPTKMESVDSNEPHLYSFKIQVFPPEDAKVIFEQAQSNLPENMDMNYQPERVLDISVGEELPKAINGTLSDSKLGNKTFCPIEESCCIERLMETTWGSNVTSLSKCQCKIQQSHNDNTAKTCEKEVMAVQEKDAFRSDEKLHTAIVRENQENGVVSVNNQAMAFLWPEITNVFSEIIDLSEDDTPDSHSESQNIDHISINSSQSSILLISDDEEHRSSSESETPNQIPSDSEQAQVNLRESSQSNSSDEKETTAISGSCTEIQSDPEVEYVPDQLKSTENMQSCTSVRSEKTTENRSCSESEVARQMTDVEENCGQAQLTSTNVEESSLETEEQPTQTSATGTPETTCSGKLKRPSSPSQFLPLSKKSKKCKSLVDLGSQPILEGASQCGKAFVQATDSEPPASDVRTVELVLFGSTASDKCVLLGSRKKHISSPEAVSDVVPRPPKVLTVRLSPLKRKTIKTVLTWNYSVKRLYKRWKISLPPAKIRHGIKLKARKCSFASLPEWSIVKSDPISPADTEELPVSPEMSILSGKTEPHLNLRWRRSHSEEFPCEEKMEKHTAMLKQPADLERNNAGNGSQAVPTLQNNDALKFSVLPVSFNFGSDGRKETKDPVPEKPDLVEEKDNNHTKTVMARGTWYSNAEKTTFSPPAPCSLFHVFKKKYMETMQPNVDK